MLLQVFNVVTQHDSATNVDISYRMAQDSSSMNAVTILTLIFLPGTFLSVGAYFFFFFFDKSKTHSFFCLVAWVCLLTINCAK